MDLNKWIGVGRLADKVKYFPADKEKGTSARALGRLIVNRPGSTSNKYDAIPIVFWDKAAENAATYTDKGKEIGIVGELHVDFIPGRNKNESQVRVEVKVIEITFGADSTAVKTARAQKQMETLPEGERATLTRAMDYLGGREELRTVVRRSNAIKAPPSPPPGLEDDIPLGDEPDWINPR